MSRGPGHVQRRVVAKLAAYERLDVKSIAQVVFNTYKKDKDGRFVKFELTRAHINSVFRAVKALAKKGTVKLSKEITPEGYPCWTLAKPVLDIEKIKRAAKNRRPSVVAPTDP